MTDHNTPADTSSIEKKKTLTHGQVVELFGGLLARTTKVSPETRAWGDSRGILPENLLPYGAVYLPPDPISWETVEALSQQVGCSVEDLLSAGIVQGRKLRPFVPTRELDGTKKDLETDTTDRRPKLSGYRFAHGGRVAYPLRDLSGRVRGYKSRAVHDDLRSVGKFDVEEEDPPTAKYLHSKRPENEKRSFQLLISPHAISILGPAVEAAKQRTPSTLKGDDRRSLWITEGDVDTMLAHQAGAMSIGLGGCETNEGHLLELLPALEEAARQKLPIFLCLDNDPARIDRGKDLEMGPGQRGVCALIGKLRTQNSDLARQIRVVSLESSETSEKIDLADVLASSPDSKAKIKELESNAVESHEYQIAQIPSGVKVRDTWATLDETGISSIAAHDPELWEDVEVGPRVAEKFGIPAKERKAWIKRIAKLAAEKAEISERKSGDDPLVRYTNKDGSVRAAYKAVYNLLQQKLGNRLVFNQMTLAPCEALREDNPWELSPIEDDRMSDFQLMLADLGCDAQRETVEQAINALALKNKRNPPETWLKSIPTWDGTDRIPFVISEVLGITEVNGYTLDQINLYSIYLRKWLRSAVARAFEPGCKADVMLVFSGTTQGQYKSSFVRALVPVDSWCGVPNLKNLDKDSVMAMRFHWINESPEVEQGLFYKDIEAYKAFLSCEADTIRPPYGRATARYPRASVLFGTSNKTAILTDPTGSRRIWCTTIRTKIQHEQLAAIRDLLWAQVVADFRAWELGGRLTSECPWWLSPDEQVMMDADCSQFEADDPIKEKLVEWLSTQPSDWVTSRQVVVGAGIGQGKDGEPTKGDYMRIGPMLARLGWTTARRGDQRGYAAPSGWEPKPSSKLHLLAKPDPGVIDLSAILSED